MTEQNGATKDPEPIVFFDITLGGLPLGRIKMQLFSHTVPQTASNFHAFCIGTGPRNPASNKPYGYKGCRFHRVITNFMIQGGDFINGDGTGSMTIFGTKSFKDERAGLHDLKHDQPGLLSMANSGPDTNGCQFFITTVPTPFLDTKHVVFGKVVDGMDVVRKIEATRVKGESRPVSDVVIAQCGEM